MLFARTIVIAVIGGLMLCSMGCSSLGLSLLPSGDSLSEQAQAVLQQSPPQAELPRELDVAGVDVHLLQPGDVVLIEPVDFESDVRIPADQRVLVDGSLDLGRYGRVLVAGLTLEMTENLIERTIVDAGQSLTHVNVRLLEPVDRYYVLGAVNSPGSFPLSGHENVLDAIVEAGGLTASAAPCSILLARPTPASSCRIVLPICYRQITQLGDTSTNYQLQPGDRVFVASRSWRDELMFWHANKPCARCRPCQTACLDPTIVSQRLSAARQSAAPDVRSIAPSNDQNGVNLIENATGVDNATVGIPTLSSSLDETALLPTASEPIKLPPTLDGELEFSGVTVSERFEPLWIKPAPDLAQPAERDQGDPASTSDQAQQ